MQINHNRSPFRSIAIISISLVLSAFARDAVPKKVSCESVSGQSLMAGHSTQSTCFMTRVTIIDSQGFRIASTTDEAIEGLEFEFNRKVSFLPVYIHEAFPNLVTFSAPSCSLKAISKENFKNLSKLKLLVLNDNQIEIIQNDVFKDLTSLEKLNLGEKNLL